VALVAQYPHIQVDADGTARIGDSRYKVLHLAGEHYYYGWSAEELLRQHPDLRPEEVYAALTYFYDHYGEMVQRLGEDAAYVREVRATLPPGLSRDELLKRRKLAEPA
jgi:uncharacterized protein (DUF433 family)